MVLFVVRQCRWDDTDPQSPVMRHQRILRTASEVFRATPVGRVRGAMVEDPGANHGEISRLDDRIGRSHYDDGSHCTMFDVRWCGHGVVSRSTGERIRLADDFTSPFSPSGTAFTVKTAFHKCRSLEVAITSGQRRKERKSRWVFGGRHCGVLSTTIPAGFDDGVPMWLARQKRANGVSIHGCVKGASIMTRRFVRRVIGERKVFGLVLTSYRADVEDEVCQEVQILQFNEGDHKWKVVLGGHEEFVSFAEDRGISVDQHCLGVSIFAVRITQEGSVLPGWLSRGRLIIPLYKYGVSVTVREVLV